MKGDNDQVNTLMSKKNFDGDKYVANTNTVMSGRGRVQKTTLNRCPGKIHLWRSCLSGNLKDKKEPKNWEQSISGGAVSATGPCMGISLVQWKERGKASAAVA